MDKEISVIEQIVTLLETCDNFDSQKRVVQYLLNRVHDGALRSTASGAQAQSQAMLASAYDAIDKANAMATSAEVRRPLNR